jgi:broad specificity phosphatase PhoE
VAKTGVITKVHVMRHGEVHNPEGILYGRLPGYHLSERGRAQAQAVADSLVDNDIVAVIASPLQRAQETAAPTAASHNLSIITDDDLIESSNYFEGKRVSPGAGAWRDPKVWWQMRNPLTPSWGEPYKEIAARMTAAMVMRWCVSVTSCRSKRCGGRWRASAWRTTRASGRPSWRR